MVNALDLLYFLFAAGTGFSTAWVGTRLAWATGWYGPDLPAKYESRLGLALDGLMAAFLGPFLLLRNAVLHRMRGEIGIMMTGVLGVVALIWAACAGVVFLQIVFASSYIFA